MARIPVGEKGFFQLQNNGTRSLLRRSLKTFAHLSSILGVPIRFHFYCAGVVFEPSIPVPLANHTPQKSVFRKA